MSQQLSAKLAYWYINCINPQLLYKDESHIISLTLFGSRRRYCHRSFIINNVLSSSHFIVWKLSYILKCFSFVICCCHGNQFIIYFRQLLWRIDGSLWKWDCNPMGVIIDSTEGIFEKPFFYLQQNPRHICWELELAAEATVTATASIPHILRTVFSVYQIQQQNLLWLQRSQRFSTNVL